MITLFVISALVPLSLCAALLYRHFSNGLQVAQQRSLDELARSYGMTILGRLGSADETLRLVISDPATTASLAEDRARELAWVKSAQPCEADLPFNARQIAKLDRGGALLISHADASGTAAMYLVRRLPIGQLLCVDLEPRWVWSDVGDYSGEGSLLVIDAEGRTLAAAGEIPAAVLPAGPSMRSTADWTVRSWELFLGSRFGSPSWTVVALRRTPSIFGTGGVSYLPIFAFIALTILLIAWLSMTAIRRQLQPLELLIGATRRLAQRDFRAFRNLQWNDEFGDLARSFDSMSGQLEKQFAALETFSDVDRLLLNAPKIESILDGILPQAAAILGCERVSVLLFDADSSGNASVFEYCASGAIHLPMRRISQGSEQAIGAEDCFTLGASAASHRIDTHRLWQEGECTGLLCLASLEPACGSEHEGVAAEDFADRLSLVIASIRHADQLRRQASFDSLTGLQNRQELGRQVELAVTAASQRGGIGSLLYIDLDHFKRVNDTSGHAAGDRLLQVVGERLRSRVDADAGIARLGGDEFAILLPSVANSDTARRTAERIIASLEAPVEIEGRVHQISASIGITLFPSDGTTLEELMRLGDIAMYRAKESGRGKAEFYHSQMQRSLFEKLRIEEDLKQTLRLGGLVLHYQPIVSTKDGETTVAVEALARWPVEGGTAWVAPSVFIPLAEENGLIVELGQWVLRCACAQFGRWKKAGVDVSYTSVNVSVRQLKEPDYLESLLRTLQENDMRADELQLEITESVLAQHSELNGILGRIAAQGVRLALDDFGTGYSSLAYLRSFPIDTVKIDRSFITGVPQDAKASRLVESIILMCEALGKKVVAEGVEVDEQRRYLLQAGCTTLQGYFLGRPMDPADIPGFAKRLRGSPEYGRTGTAP